MLSLGSVNQRIHFSRQPQLQRQSPCLVVTLVKLVSLCLVSYLHVLTDLAYEVAWSRWRVSTALLLKSEDASLRTQAREYWLDRLQRRLEPFQLNTPGINAQTREDLYAICKLAENLASLVYSQPARWEFNWPKRSQLVIFPDFVRATDNSARRLDRPRCVVDAQVMQ